MGNIRHTGENIAKNIKQCIKNNGLLEEKIVCCVRDNARNMENATERLEFERFFKVYSYYYYYCY